MFKLLSGRLHIAEYIKLRFCLFIQLGTNKKSLVLVSEPKNLPVQKYLLIFDFISVSEYSFRAVRWKPAWLQRGNCRSGWHANLGSNPVSVKRWSCIAFKILQSTIFHWKSLLFANTTPKGLFSLVSLFIMNVHLTFYKILLLLWLVFCMAFLFIEIFQFLLIYWSWIPDNFFLCGFMPFFYKYSLLRNFLIHDLEGYIKP